MKKLLALMCLLLCACMLCGLTAMAEESAAGLAAEEVVAVINGRDVTWADVEESYESLVSQYGSGYDMTLPETVEMFRTVALQNTLTELLLEQKAAELGLSELSEEEIAQLDEAAVAEWQEALQQYVDYATEVTAESTDEEKAAALQEAEEYYGMAGYSEEILKELYHKYAVMEKLESHILDGVTVTDEEIEANYQALVATDKELYENDLAAYVDYNNQVDMMSYYAAIYGISNDMDYAWYKPEGFRAVKHILLPVDEELMNAYTDLQARYEEQAYAEDEQSADEPVTAEQVNAAKAAILASLADKIEEINAKLDEGVDFDQLIAEYGVDADGNPSDPGMANEPYMTTGYEVCAVSSNYVPEFVDAAMSISELGGVSAPYLSSYGVHIVKYIADVPGGPIEMTEAQRAAMYQSLLSAKQNERYSEVVTGWMDESAITYTGVIASYDELMAAEEEAE